MSAKTKSKGFTIIEVVLVLAIAGLIFLMVFIALPALQKSQRDTQRKNDLSRIMVQLTNYASNNRGSIPSSLVTATLGGKTFVEGYLGGDTASIAGDEYKDPATGTGYVFLPVDSSQNKIVEGTVFYAQGGICGIDGAITGGKARQYALLTKLENQSSLYCVDNQ
ncbi:MAG: type II secretion system protein [Candidatus Saccharibacteria bacterium]